VQSIQSYQIRHVVALSYAVLLTIVQLPNFLKGLDGQLREGSPKDITSRDTLGFMVSLSFLSASLY
jgi:hypothetical protein